MTAPNWLWAKSSGSPSNDYAKIVYGSSSVATDQGGNSYVTGSFNGPMTFPGNITLTSTSYPKVFVAKFDTNGLCLWAKEFGGDNSDTYGNQGESIDIDLNGNCYVCGTFHGSSGSTITLKPGVTLTGTGAREIFTVRFTSNGTPRWARQPSSGTPTPNNYAKSITANQTGSSYTTGYLGGIGTTFGTSTLNGPGAYVVKHKRNGTVSWATKVGDGGVDGMSICVGAGNATYVTGYLQGSNTFATSGGNITLTSIGTRDVFLAKLSGNGTLLWVQQYGSAGVTAYGRGVDIDAYGDLYLTGNRDSSMGGNEAFALKVDTSGAAVWDITSANSSQTQGNAIKVAPTGGCYIAGQYAGFSDIQFGTTLPNNSGSTLFVIHFDANGNAVWLRTAGNTNTGETALGIDIDGAGHLYIAGHAQGPAQFGTSTLASYGGLDAFVAKLDRTGCGCCSPALYPFPWTSGSILDPGNSDSPNFTAPEVLEAKFALGNTPGTDGLAFMGLKPLHRAARLIELSVLKLPLPPVYVGPANLDIVVMDYAGVVLRTISTTTLDLATMTDRTWAAIPLSTTAGDLDIVAGEVVAGRLTMTTGYGPWTFLVYHLSGTGHFL